MAIEKVALMQEYLLKHLRMGTARMQEDKKKQRVKKSRKEWKWKEAKWARNKAVPIKAQLQLWPTIHSGSLFPEDVYELPN